jgi:hypothetical protein
LTALAMQDALVSHSLAAIEYPPDGNQGGTCLQPLPVHEIVKCCPSMACDDILDRMCDLMVHALSEAANHQVRVDGCLEC